MKGYLYKYLIYIKKMWACWYLYCTFLLFILWHFFLSTTRDSLMVLINAWQKQTDSWADKRTKLFDFDHSHNEMSDLCMWPHIMVLEKLTCWPPRRQTNQTTNWPHNGIFSQLFLWFYKFYKFWVQIRSNDRSIQFLYLFAFRKIDKIVRKYGKYSIKKAVLWHLSWWYI